MTETFALAAFQNSICRTTIVLSWAELLYFCGSRKSKTTKCFEVFGGGGRLPFSGFVFFFLFRKAIAIYMQEILHKEGALTNSVCMHRFQVFLVPVCFDCDINWQVIHLLATMYQSQNKYAHYSLKIRMATASLVGLIHTVNLHWRNIRRIIPSNVFSQSYSNRPLLAFCVCSIFSNLLFSKTICNKTVETTRTDKWILQYSY